MTKEELMMSKDIIEVFNFINKNGKLSGNAKKQTFLKKYSTYYSNPKIKNKIDFYKKSINGDKKINPIKKEITNLKWLKKTIELYNSDLSLFKKIEKITDIYKDYNDFWLSYYDLIIPLMDTTFIKELNKIFMFLKNNSNVIEFVRYYSDNVKKYGNLEYANYIIVSYLNKDEGLSLEEFLYAYGIDNKIFDYCVDTICEFDVDLYNKFIKKKKINDSNEMCNNRKLLIDLAVDLKNSFYKGKSTFSVSEFFKRVAFKYDRNFSNTLLKYIKENIPQDYDVFHDYIYLNKFYKKNIIKELSIEEILNSYIVFEDDHIGNNDKLRVLTYMQENDYPMINVVFYDLLEKYVKNELVLSEIKEIKRRKYLIP